jgi:hypothetical protein
MANIFAAETTNPARSGTNCDEFHEKRQDTEFYRKKMEKTKICHKKHKGSQKRSSLQEKTERTEKRVAQYSLWL